jgi:hypothetical protein
MSFSPIPTSFPFFSLFPFVAILLTKHGYSVWRPQCSGIWRRVAWQECTDSSEEFDRLNEDSRILWHISMFVPEHTASHPRRWQSYVSVCYPVWSGYHWKYVAGFVIMCKLSCWKWVGHHYLYILLMNVHIVNECTYYCWSQWPRGLRRGSAAARLLGLWVRIPQQAWMSVCCECCVLSGRGLCDGLITRPEESYRAWCV